MPTNHRMIATSGHSKSVSAAIAATPCAGRPSIATIGMDANATSAADHNKERMA